MQQELIAVIMMCNNDDNNNNNNTTHCPKHNLNLRRKFVTVGADATVYV